MRLDQILALPSAGMLALGVYGESLQTQFTAFISTASGVSADGQRIVGYISVATNRAQGFLWTSENGLQLLDDLFQTALPPGWTFVTAAAISGNGRRIIGNAFGPERAIFAITKLEIGNRKLAILGRGPL